MSRNCLAREKKKKGVSRFSQEGKRENIQTLRQKWHSEF